MERSDPQEPSPPDPREPSTPSEAREALRRLEQRLDRASDAAERLIAEAAAHAARARPEPAGPGGEHERTPAGSTDKPPPAGWASRDGSEHEPAGKGEAELLVQVVQSLRDLVPPELQRRLAEALREVLLAIRALIDWYLERLEQQRSEPAEVEDIPIT